MPKIPTIPSQREKLPSPGLAVLKLPRPKAEDLGAGAFRALGEFGQTIQQLDQRWQAERERVAEVEIRTDAVGLMDRALVQLEEAPDHRTYFRSYDQAEKSVRDFVAKEFKARAMRPQTSKLVEAETNALLGRYRSGALRRERELTVLHHRGRALGDLTEISRQAARAPTIEESNIRLELGRRTIEMLQRGGAINPVEAEQWRQRYEDAVKKSRVEFFEVDLRERLDELQNRAIRDPVNAGEYQRQGMAEIRRAAGDWLPEEKRAAVRRQFSTTLWHGAVKGLIEDNPEQTLEELKKGTYDEIVTPAAALQLRREAEVEIERRKRAAEAERKEREREIGKLVSDYDDAKMAGFEWRGPVSEARLGELARGTEHEEKFARVTGASAALSRFNQLAPIAQEEALRQIRQGAKTGFEAKFSGLLERAHEATRRGLDEDPLSHGSRVLRIDLESVDPTDPASLQKRTEQAGMIAEQFGVSTPVFTRDEAAAITKRLDAMPPAQRAQAYAAIGRALPDEAADATFSQFAKSGQKDSAVIADIARVDAGAAELVLQGRQLRRDSKAFRGIFSVRAEKDLFQRIDSEVQSAYKHSLDQHWPHIRQAIGDAYLALHAKAGFGAEEMDDGTLDEAIERVTGGLLNIRGQTIVAPKRKVTESGFMRMLADDSLWTDLGPGFSKGTILSRTDAKFESAGSGRYYIRFGAGYVKDRNGKTFLLDLRGVLPPARLGSARAEAILESKVLSGLVK